MAKYKKDKSRIDIKFIDSETDEELVTINNRNWMNVGEIFVDGCVDQIMKTEVKNLPKSVLVIAVSEYTLVNE